nr:hypothetical protein [Acidobacteriota bacterium]
MRKNTGYKMRPDGAERHFGGINLLMFGDWWQIKPVAGTALFSNPAYAGGVTGLGMDIFWGPEPNCVHRLWELTEIKRTDDPWFIEILRQCRHGELDEENYHLINGFPTKTPLSLSTASSPGRRCCCCARGSSDTGQLTNGYYATWSKAFLDQGLTGAELVAQECTTCQHTRKDKRVALYDDEPATESLRLKPFDTAPGLYLYNVPRYETILLRAREYAKANEFKLYWLYAQDVPLHRGDRDLSEEDLHKKRMRWLGNHDQKTGHLSSVCPLAKGMPIRLLDNIDKRRQLFRGRKGYIQDWIPHPETDIEDTPDGDLVYSKLPKLIYVKFPGATWRVHTDLEVGVFPIQPRSRTWQLRNNNSDFAVRRTGFCLIPDFGATAHMCQGQTLDAAFVDALEAWTSVNSDMQVSVYVMLSRVKLLKRL